MPTAIAIHALFDVLAWASALVTMIVMRKIFYPAHSVPKLNRFSYLTAIIFGAAVSAYIFGTLNLYLSGETGIARSIAGALAGAIIAIEIYKKFAHIKTRTGAIYAAPVAIGIMVGRFGCHFSGLQDFTYGIATNASWGHDFGDGILRYSVQLAESAAMAAFLALYLIMMARKSPFWHANGFYMLVGWYGVERFLLEFLKPYGNALIGMSVFQLLSIGFVVYAVVMIWTNEKKAYLH
jgi:prolipoprotein diacylglyceryltransferase